MLLMRMKANAAGSRITNYDIAHIVNEALTKVAWLDIAACGFKCTGVYEFDGQLFSNLNYFEADMSNIPIEVPETFSNLIDYSKEKSTCIVCLEETGCSTQLRRLGSWSPYWYSKMFRR